MYSALILAGAAAVASATNLNVPGYARQSLGDAAINAPITNDCYTYIQESTYTDVTSAAQFNPERCIIDCQQTSAYNKQYLNSRATCRFVNTYILLKDGVSQGQVCAMYTDTWGPAYATNTGYTYDGCDYTIIDSYTYSNISDPGVPGQSCIGSSSNSPPAYPSTTSTTVVTTTHHNTHHTPPAYPSTTLTTVVTTTQHTTPVAPTTTSTTQQTTPVAQTTTTTAGNSSPTPVRGDRFQCRGTLSSPQCCDVNALGVVSLTCNPPSTDFRTKAQFEAICAADGTTAQCCLLSALGQGLVCQDV